MIFTAVEELLGSIVRLCGSEGAEAFLRVVRFALPALGILIVSRCALSLLSGKSEREVWGYLSLPNGARVELAGWENVLGRGRSSDVVLPYTSVSRTHAVLTRDASGEWSILDTGSKNGVKVNGRRAVGPVHVKTGDIITIGSIKTVFAKSSCAQERAQAQSRSRPGRVNPTLTMLLLSAFILLLGFDLCAGEGESLSAMTPLAVFELLAASWVSYLFTRGIDRVGFEVETLAFLLSAIGLTAWVGEGSEDVAKYIVCLLAGVILFWILGGLLRDLDRVRRLRIPIAAAGLVLLAVNLLASDSVLGAKNWILIGGVSFQPSELVKICFIFAGSAPLSKLFTKRSLWLFVGFAAVCVGCLVLMNDFGTALVFFTAYLVIAFLRSGSFATILLSGAGAGLAAVIAVSMRPYVAERFSAWGHAWESYNYGSGYQQTRTMAASASGGLFGLGAERGSLRNIFAADTDMVFGLVCEELGLLLALCAVAAILVLAVFVVKSAGTARSAFYSIASCGAVALLICQTALNVFGSLDILPFTGVTFPFVSKGGTSLIASWGLAGFIKAADVRQNGSFTVRLPSEKGGKQGA